jgi:hypothetical protein
MLITIATAALLTGCTPSTNPVALTPRIDGKPWKVAGNPDLGALTSEKQQPVDFGIWQAADGTWQIWSCIRSTKAEGHHRLFHRWEGPQLTDTNWKPMGIAMQADEKYGEENNGLQAPYVVKNGSEFVMFYGDWTRICLAKSSDGKKFERWMIKDANSPAIFQDGPKDHARDPMTTRIGDAWYCYYTASPEGKGIDFCRVSTNLKDWSDQRMVSVGGKGGTGRVAAECPQVVQRGGYYYLFRTQLYGAKATTHVYRSKDPLRFNINSDAGYVCTLPIAAPEIFTYNGQDYVAYLLPSLQGIQIAKLTWDPAPER